MTVSPTYDKVNQTLLEAAREAWDGLPGLHNYYESRLREGSILCAGEWSLIQWVVQNRPRDAFVMEIAAGGAQLSAALGIFGFSNLHVVECWFERMRIACALFEKLGLEGTFHQTDWVIVVDGLIPSDTVWPLNRPLMVTYNAVSSRCSKHYTDDASGFTKWLTVGCHIVLNPRLYGSLEDADEPMPFENLAGITIATENLQNDLVHYWAQWCEQSPGLVEYANVLIHD